MFTETKPSTATEPGRPAPPAKAAGLEVGGERARVARDGCRADALVERGSALRDGQRGDERAPPDPPGPPRVQPPAELLDARALEVRAAGRLSFAVRE